MGIFVSPALTYALPTLPAAAAGPAATGAAPSPAATPVAASPAPASDRSPIYWGRLIFAFMLLITLMVAGIWATKSNLPEWGTMLLHSFELTFGLILGLLGGELAARTR